MQTELLLWVIAKALLELAGMFLLGRALLYVLAGKNRDQNWFYSLFCVITRPVVTLARAITPRFVLDRHIPLVAFMPVLWAWLILVFIVLPGMCASPSIDCKPLLERKAAD